MNDNQSYSPLLVTLLLLCGVGLVLICQLAQTRLAGPNGALYAVQAAGALLFVVGVAASQRPALQTRLTAFFGRIGSWLQITPPQVVLLPVALLLAYLARLASGDGALAQHALLASTTWLLAIVCALVAALDLTDQRQPFAVNWTDVAIAAGFFCGALLLRVTLLDQFPTTLSGDEASAGLSAVDFLQGKADNWFSIGWFSFPSFFYAMQSVAIRLFGQTTVALRLWGALAGAATVAGLYGLVRLLFGRTAALCAAALLMASHYHIHFSRIGLQNVWDGLFTVLALLGLWWGWQHGARLGFILTGLALGLGQYFYVSFRALPIIVLVWTLVAATFNWSRFRQRFAGLALAAWLALIVYLPLALFFLANPDEFNAPLQRVSLLESLDELVANSGQPSWRIVLESIGATAAGITHLPLEHWYNVGVPLLLPLAATLFLLGCLWAIATFDLRHLLIALPILAVIVAGGLSRDAPASQRYVIIGTLVPILVALPLAGLADWIATHHARYRMWAFATIALLTVSLTARDLNFYFRDVFGDIGYVLGGFNTETGNVLANHLAPIETAQEIYFFGWPRMNYASIAVVPYLAPQHSNIDVMEPLQIAPSWQLAGPTQFIFLPERASELDLVRQQYPNGDLINIDKPGTDRSYFTIYEVVP